MSLVETLGLGIFLNNEEELAKLRRAIVNLQNREPVVKEIIEPKALRPKIVGNTGLSRTETVYGIGSQRWNKARGHQRYANKD